MYSRDCRADIEQQRGDPERRIEGDAVAEVRRLAVTGIGRNPDPVTSRQLLDKLVKASIAIAFSSSEENSARRA